MITSAMETLLGEYPRHRHRIVCLDKLDEKFDIYGRIICSRDPPAQLCLPTIKSPLELAGGKRPNWCIMVKGKVNMAVGTPSFQASENSSKVLAHARTCSNLNVG